MTSPNLLFRLIYITVFILVLSGCALHRPDTNPLLDGKALFLANQARSFNQHIMASKGTGWIRLETKTQTDKFKIAWAAVSPNKIRITFLLSGHPVETIIATGEKVIFLSHTGKHSRYTSHSKDPNMKNYIHVPIKLSEMISILLGRLPVKRFDTAYFSPSDTSLSTLNLMHNWKGLTQSLFLNSTGRVEGLRTINSSGKILYEMTITEYRDTDFGSIPVKIEIKDTDDRKLTLVITDFQPNPPIKESVFRLTGSR